MELPAIKVVQPLGDFFVTRIRASDLLKVSFVEKLEYINAEGRLKGTQRKADKTRLDEIAKFIKSTEMAFPSSIILGANYTEEGNVLEEEEEEEEGKATTEKITWKVREEDCEEFYKIIVPTSLPLAAIIDGQHRTNAFRLLAEGDERLEVELPCAVFFDLPNAYQAYLFATINGNQRKVDRSLALEQFGFNVEDEDRKSWTPEKLAVFFSRKLNIQEASPFYKHIKVAPGNERVLFKKPRTTEWTISTATIVDGILNLISSNPKRDRVDMAQKKLLGRDRLMVADTKDHAPLRQQYLARQDDEIYSIVNNYFIAVSSILWTKASTNSYIIKTVGVLALFDLLKRILIDKGINAPFASYLEPAASVDFSDIFFQASGVGRSRVKHVLFAAANLRKATEKMSDYNEMQIARLLKRTPSNLLPAAE